MPRQWMARVIAVLWMFTGVVFVAFYTAQLTATLTVQQIQGSINGPDLPGRRLGTTQGSTAAAFLMRRGGALQGRRGAEFPADPWGPATRANHVDLRADRP
jgi:hypothetical protein